jgi:hypothetical protein
MDLQSIGTAAGFVFTLIIFSYLIRDNWLYRLAIYVFIGLTAAFTFIVTVESLLPYIGAMIRLIGGTPNETDAFAGLSFIIALILMVPLVIARLPVVGPTPGRGVTLGLLIAVGSAVAVLGTLTGTLLPFILSTGRAINVNRVNGIILLIGVVTSLLYFQYGVRRSSENSAERRSWSQAIGQGIRDIGQVFIVITLGALYGTAIITSLTILTARLSVLVKGS